MAAIDRFFAKINKAQGTKYLIKYADHAEFPGPNEYALIQEGNSSFHMYDVTMKMMSHQIIFCTLPAAAETNQYRHLR